MTQTTEYGRKHTDGSRSGGQPVTDHQRGCAGRDYTCTCGYEDARDSRLEAFKQEVSNIVSAYVYVDGGPDDWEKLNSLIIPTPKPDPLVEVLLDMELSSDLEEGQHDAKWIRLKLDARGLEIREKNDD